MVLIGITGGIGSGKSTVCSLFVKKNIPVFYADEVAREISESSALHEIVTAFGNEIITPQNTLDRKTLARIVFHDTKKLQLLNSIIHPKVFSRFNDWKVRQHSSSRYLLAEAALMFESGMFELMDYVLAVVADDEVRIERAGKRTNESAEDIRARMRHQMSPEELKELSDFQLNNSGSLEHLSASVSFYHTLFSTLQQRKELQ